MLIVPTVATHSIPHEKNVPYLSPLTAFRTKKMFPICRHTPSTTPKTTSLYVAEVPISQPQNIAFFHYFLPYHFVIYSFTCVCKIKISCCVLHFSFFFTHPPRTPKRPCSRIRSLDKRRSQATDTQTKLTPRPTPQHFTRKTCSQFVAKPPQKVPRLSRATS